jgi:hypothetical protein
MRILSLRRQAGKGGKGAWVRNEDTGAFERYARISHTNQSGNQTLEWDLKAGRYTYQENWYGKITRDTITVAAEEEAK